MIRAFLLFLFLSVTFTFSGGFWLYKKMESDLPPIESINDYKPLLVTQVYDRHNKKIGEFFKERRILIPIQDIPKPVIQAFLAAEDDQFYEHKGINWLAIARASLANLKAGQRVQGASTITQQLVKTLFLTPEKTFERKFKEMLLAQKIEQNLSKDEILYLYLNQIFFGQNSYGIRMASETYFRKSVKDLTVEEAAILAGLPKAPSAYSPVRNPKKAKERQLYVLKRMADLGYLSPEAARQASEMPVKVFMRESFVAQSHGFVETVRLLLSKQLPEEDLVTKGYYVKTTIDLEQQIEAQKSVETHLRQLDKRQGFRGAVDHLSDKAQWSELLQKYKLELEETYSPERMILPTGDFQKASEFNPDYQASQGIPPYMSLNSLYKALVTEISDTLGLAYVQVGELKGLIDIDTARWARPFDPESRSYSLARFSTALKVGDVVWVRLKAQTFNLTRLQKLKDRQKNLVLPQTQSYVQFDLEQEPLVEGALLTLDNREQDVIAMVPGYDFKRSQFNRVLQALRQTGSSFKTFVYAAALDRGYHPSSLLLDTPVVYENQGQKFEEEWKPTNHSRSYDGEVTLRNALIRSLNVPAVKVVEDIGVPFARDYARRLGIFSKLNDDFTLVLGSSSVTLYEMTKAFSVFARLGKRIHPRIVKEVQLPSGEIILSDVGLDQWFSDALVAQDKEFEDRRVAYLDKVAQSSSLSPGGEPSLDRNSSGQDSGDMGDSQDQGSVVVTEETFGQREKKLPIEPAIFFKDPEQLISPQTAYLMNSILSGVIRDPNGTAARAAPEIPFEVAGKTGSTNDYVDGWFVGYSPLYTTGVWVGFDQEKTLGPSEVGGRTALPVWIDVMKSLHKKLPTEKLRGEKSPGDRSSFGEKSSTEKSSTEKSSTEKSSISTEGDLLKFEIPEGIEFIKVDYETGELAKPGSRRVISQPFRWEDRKNLEETQVREENAESTKEDLDE
jgi:penicillin-binding protein 1A